MNFASVNKDAENNALLCLFGGKLLSVVYFDTEAGRYVQLFVVSQNFYMLTVAAVWWYYISYNVS